MKTNEKETIHFKLLAFGEEECGKTCLIKRYCEQRFDIKYNQTIGIDYGLKRFVLKNSQAAVF